MNTTYCVCISKKLVGNIGMPVVQTDGRSVYGHVIAKFSRMDRFSKLWGFEMSQ